MARPFPYLDFAYIKLKVLGELESKFKKSGYLHKREGFNSKIFKDRNSKDQKNSTDKNFKDQREKIAQIRKISRAPLQALQSMSITYIVLLHYLLE